MQILPQRRTSLILKAKINHSTTKVISIYLYIYTYIQIQFYNSPQLVTGLWLLISTQQVSPFTYLEIRFVKYLFWKIYQETTTINIWGYKELSMSIKYKSLQLYKKSIGFWKHIYPFVHQGRFKIGFDETSWLCP